MIGRPTLRSPWLLRPRPLQRRIALLVTIVLAVLLIERGAEAAMFAESHERALGTGMLAIAVALTGMVALGMPLFVIIGVITMLSFGFMSEDFQGVESLEILSDKTAQMMNQPVLLAIPFFVTSGAIMSAGGMAQRLVDFARALVGWVPGGLAVATVGSCIFFAAISGSSPVTVIAIGSMMYPQLREAGYDKRFSLGLLSSAGSLGILIPPSIPMLVYAIVASGSRPIDAAELFLGGVLPGLMIGGLLIGYSIIKGSKSDREPFDTKVLMRRFRRGIWAIGLPVLILGGIYSGLFTPTEAAAVSVVYALAVELLIHRDLKVKELMPILVDAATTMGTLLIIMALAVGLNAFLVEEQIPDEIVRWILEMELTPLGFLLIVNVLLLVVGALMDSISAILIIAPLLAPVAIKLGIDPVHLGIIFIVNLEIGYLTPPIGINLFVASSVFRESIGEVARGVIPFIGLMVLGLAAVTYVPTISLGPVNLIMRDAPFFSPFPDGIPEEGSGDPNQAGKMSMTEMMELVDADDTDAGTGESGGDTEGDNPSLIGGGDDETGNPSLVGGAQNDEDDENPSLVGHDEEDENPSLVGGAAED